MGDADVLDKATDLPRLGRTLALAAALTLARQTHPWGGAQPG